MVVAAAQQLCVEHPFHLQVGSVLRRPVHGRRAVEPRHAHADRMAVGAGRLGRRLAGADELGRVLDRLDDLGVAGAAAQVLREALDDLGARRVGLGAQERMRLEDHAGDAEAALGRALDEERLLQRVQHRQVVFGLQAARARRQTLDGHDVLVRGAPGGEQACLGRLAPHQHDAAPALAVVARLLGAGEVEVFAQDVEQRRRAGIHRDALSVHPKSTAVSPIPGSLRGPSPMRCCGTAAGRSVLR